MIHPTLLLSLHVSFTTPTPAQADTVLYVKPTEGTKCPSEPCHTLDWYVNETHHHEYFPYNDTVMKLLPGTHNLSESFNFHNLTNLTLEATSPAMNETVIFCNDRPQALFFSHGSQIAIEGLSSVNCTLLFQNCAYVRINRVTIEVLGNAGIVAVTVHSIKMSLVFIHILKGIGINLWGDVTGNCIFEEVEVTSLDSHSRAITMYPPCELQSQYKIRRCSFELQVLIQSPYGNNCQSINNLVILENIFFKNIIGIALDLRDSSISVLLQNVTFANKSLTVAQVL